MKVLVLGCGLVGSELAHVLLDRGDTVIGTTTTPGKVEKLQEICTDVAVLRGSDADAVAKAAVGCDAIAVCAGPSAQAAMTVEERAASYHEILVSTAESVASAPGDPHLVMLSSFSVYGDAANHLDEVTEDSPLTTVDDPSPQKFQEAERTYVKMAGDRTAVLRCADIFGGEDPPIEDKVKMAHQYLGGSVPFGSDPLFYRVHVTDVVRAIAHVIEHRLTGTFNLTHAAVPPTNGQLFDAISEQEGLPKFEYRNELLAPTVPISVAKLAATGFETTHTPVQQLP